MRPPGRCVDASAGGKLAACDPHKSGQQWSDLEGDPACVVGERTPVRNVALFKPAFLSTTKVRARSAPARARASCTLGVRRMHMYRC